MTEKRQTLQGYIIRILQHFATKLWNITNFVMLFQAVMKFLSRHNLVYNTNGPLHAVFGTVLIKCT
jgi:valyl-tRNA synthetase